MPDSASHPSPSSSARKGRAVRKPGRPTRAQLAGRRTWIHRLLTAGRIQEACTFAASVNLLHCLPPDAVSAHSRRLAEGGEGVAAGGGDKYNYNSTPEGLILQSGESLVVGPDAVMEVAEAVSALEATAEPVLAGEEVQVDSTGSSASNVAPLHGHSPAGELEGNRGFGQAGIDTNSPLTQSNISSQWVEEGEGLVGKLCRNKQYNELRLEGREVVGGGGRKAELWTKVGNWHWRSGLVRGERVWVKRIWVSADDTDSEYLVVRRMDVNEGVEEQQQQSEQPQPVPVIKDVIEPIEEVLAQAAPEPDRSSVLPQFLKEEPVYPRKPETADEYIARIRADTAKWANGMGA